MINSWGQCTAWSMCLIRFRSIRVWCVCAAFLDNRVVSSAVQSRPVHLQRAFFKDFILFYFIYLCIYFIEASFTPNPALYQKRRFPSVILMRAGMFYLLWQRHDCRPVAGHVYLFSIYSCDVSVCLKFHFHFALVLCPRFNTQQWSPSLPGCWL